MRFRPSGPEIPNELIKLQRSGRLVFIAGAGVSMGAPANLPSFRGLILQVLREIGDPLLPVLEKAAAATGTSQQRMLGSIADPTARVEANLFLSGEFDRQFSMIEARLDRDASGRAISRTVRSAVEQILRRHGGPNRGHRDLIRISTVRPAESDSRAVARCRITTTNFDRLLEKAWEQELGYTCRGTDARLAPRPGSFNFEGVIHLHGLLNADDTIENDFVLTSRDFSRSYLRSGVVANYVYDLVRKYAVVLVGYSAEDPVMRYLMDAIGEDATLFDDMHTPYAFAGHDASKGAGDAQIEIATWNARNITPILYDQATSPTTHENLWESLSDWADWVRDGDRWLEDRCTALMAEAPQEDDFRTAFVRNALAIVEPAAQRDLVERLGQKDLPFGWIEFLTLSPTTNREVTGTANAG